MRLQRLARLLSRTESTDCDRAHGLGEVLAVVVSAGAIAAVLLLPAVPTPQDRTCLVAGYTAWVARAATAASSTIALLLQNATNSSLSSGVMLFEPFGSLLSRLLGLYCFLGRQGLDSEIFASYLPVLVAVEGLRRVAPICRRS
jgi:hypothetical protein